MFLFNFTEHILPVLVLAILGLLFGVLIAVLSKVLYVEEDNRITTVTEMLPGYNCGACGYPGCNGLATAIIEKGASVNLCKPIKPIDKEKLNEWLRNQADSN
ncbi:MAG: (Fe-S)-binding protein [Bacilli bacterium]|jgi:electron transport complex protein RnfB